MKNLKPDEKFVKLSVKNKRKLHKEKSLYLAEFGLNKGFFMAGAEGLEPSARGFGVGRGL